MSTSTVSRYAQACIPPRATWSRKKPPVTRFPMSRPCWSGKATRTVSISPPRTSFSRPSRVRLPGMAPLSRGFAFVPNKVFLPPEVERRARMRTAIFCTGLLGLLVFGLGLAVSMVRGSRKTNFAYTVDPTDRLYKMVRAHGNAAEYAPMLAILILYVGVLHEPARWVLWTAMAATASRYLHALGMILSKSLDQTDPLRFLGALGTYVTGLLLVAAMLVAR